ATCMPAWVVELSENYVLDKRYSDTTPDRAMDDLTDGTRYVGIIDGTFGNASTNFYHLPSTDCLFEIQKTWGGDINDEVILTNGRISERRIILKQRLG